MQHLTIVAAIVGTIILSWAVIMGLCSMETTTRRQHWFRTSRGLARARLLVSWPLVMFIIVLGGVCNAVIGFVAMLLGDTWRCLEDYHLEWTRQFKAGK